MNMNPFKDTQSRAGLGYTYGLTLVELLIGLAIFSIVATAATPQLSYWLAKAEADNVSNTLYKHLQFTRYIAVSQREQITLCMLDPSGQCSASAAETLIVFKDKNRNREYNDGEDVIVQIPFKPLGTIRLNATLGVVRFDEAGHSHTFSSFIYCPKRTDTQQGTTSSLIKRVVISNTGRIRIDTNVSKRKSAIPLC